jgi:hypothetical protein
VFQDVPRLVRGPQAGAESFSLTASAVADPFAPDDLGYEL